MPDPLTPDPALTPRIFISHSHADEAYATALAADLQRAGAYVWMDTGDSNEVGFLERMNAGLAQCDWLALVETAASLASQRVRMEVDAAQARTLNRQLRGVIRLLAAPHDMSDLPPAWATFQYYDARADYGSAVAAMLAAIHYGDVRWLAQAQAAAPPQTGQLPKARGPRWQALLVALGGALLVIGYLLPWSYYVQNNSYENLFFILQNILQRNGSDVLVGAALLSVICGLALLILGGISLAHGFTSGRLGLGLIVSSVMLVCFLLLDYPFLIIRPALSIPGPYLALLGCLLPFASTFFSFHVPNPQNPKSAVSSPIHPTVRVVLLSALGATTGLFFPWTNDFLSPATFLFYITSGNGVRDFLYTPHVFLTNVLWTALTLLPLIAIFTTSGYLARFNGRAHLTTGQGYRTAWLLATVSALIAIALCVFWFVGYAAPFPAPFTNPYTFAGYGVGFWLTVIAALGMVGATIGVFVSLGRAQRLGQLQP